MKSLLRRLLSEKARARISCIRAAIRARWVLWAAQSGLLSYLWYMISAHFRADFVSFIAGAALFHRKERQRLLNLSQLRRDIHRLEKGLSFPKRRDVFALRFIGEAVDQFCLLASDKAAGHSSEYPWARDVLKEYFAATDCDDAAYVEAQNRFERTVQLTERMIAGNVAPQETEPLAAEVPGPYRNRTDPDASKILESLLRQRKSVRSYRPDPVDRRALETALAAASCAPSSCNRQPYRYHLITDTEKARAVAAVSAGTTGWLEEIHNVAVLVSDRSYFANAVNRHSIYVDSTLSVMPFVLSLEAQGVSTCLINWADDFSRRSQMARLIGLKPHQRVIISIAFGYADHDAVAPYSKRKFINEISRYAE